MSSQLRHKWVAFGILGLGLSLGIARADQVITPPGGQGWSEGDSASSLLNMNHDPNFMRKSETGDPEIVMRGTCRGANGRIYHGNDPDYAACMNAKMRKEASVSNDRNEIHKLRSLSNNSTSDNRKSSKAL